jgi:oxalate decarboxylase
LAALIIELEPGAMREIHWHPNADEWQYYIEGEPRMTVFDATSKARTFNYGIGDVGYVPRAPAHYIEDIGTSKVRPLNVFNDPEFKDVPLNQCLALTRPI